MPASHTAMTTTRRPSRRVYLYVCTATQPPCPACSTMFWHDSLSVMPKRAGDGGVELELPVQNVGGLVLNAPHHAVHVVALARSA